MHPCSFMSNENDMQRIDKQLREIGFDVGNLQKLFGMQAETYDRDGDGEPDVLTGDHVLTAKVIQVDL